MSVTGQVGHIALAKQTAFGTPNTTAGNYKAVKITGDSLAAANNMIVAEGEIGTGRDVSEAIPGGFAAAGAVNGNLTTRAAAAFLYGALGAITAVTGPPATDTFDVADTLPTFTLEKKVGTTGAQLLTLRYQDVMVNTLNLSIASGGLSTFSAGLVATQESYITGGPIAAETYPAASADLLVFHGGRIKTGDSADGGAVTYAIDTRFQSMEIAVNNNVDTSEYTIQPSRFLRGLTEGIRSVEVNFQIVFDDHALYQQYTYGATGRTTPGYALYLGAMNVAMVNWQLASGDDINTASPTGAPASPQGFDVTIPKLAFSGFPVQLTSGRIVVSTSARALKPTTGNIIVAQGRPSGAAF